MNFDLAVFEKSVGFAHQLMQSDLPEVVFSGRSNVGKSSLINKLLGKKKLARVSKTPGKTVTVNFFRLPGARFVDLPGYGYAKRSNLEIMRWSELVETYFASGRKIALVVQLIDIRHCPTQQDLTMLDYLMRTNHNYIIGLTKSDKVKKSQLNDRIEQLKGELGFAKDAKIIALSSETGYGIDELKGIIKQEVNKMRVG